MRDISDPELTVTRVETSVAQQAPRSGFPAVGKEISAGFAAGVGLNTVVAGDQVEKPPDAALCVSGLHQLAALVAGLEQAAQLGFSLYVHCVLLCLLVAKPKQIQIIKSTQIQTNARMSRSSVTHKTVLESARRHRQGGASKFIC